MAEPILVVHGVANRSRTDFEALVHNLNTRVGDDYRMIPVFWGDLGAQITGRLDAVPKLPEASSTPGMIDPVVIEAVLGQSDTRDTVNGDGTARHDLIVQGATKQLAQSPATVRGADSAEGVREAVRDTLPTTRYLKFVQDPTVLDAIGRAVDSAAPATPIGTVMRSYRQFVKPSSCSTAFRCCPYEGKANGSG